MVNAIDPNTLPKAITEGLTRVKIRLMSGQIQEKSSRATAPTGFIAAIMTRMNPVVWTRDISTAAVSTDTLYWNPDFFERFGPDQRCTHLAHELWHVGLLHHGRLEERDPDVWNQAGDYVINAMLKEQGFDMSGFPYLLDDQFNGKSTEQVYEILLKKKEDEKAKNPGACAPMVRPDGLEGGTPSDAPPTQDPGQPNQGGNDPSSPGSGQQPDLSSCSINGSDLIKPTKKQIEDAVSVVVSAKVTVMGGHRKPGDIPGEVELMIDEFLNPKLPWQTLLYNYFNAMVNDSRSYARPNRRFDDPLLPGNSGRDGLEHLAYFQDISGSITDEQILFFNSELKFVQEELQPDRMTVMTFDTKIRDTWEFEREQAFEKIKAMGRGGTELRDVYEWIDKNQPTAAIIFTDMEVDIPPDPKVPILWICVDSPRATAPYGTLIHVDT